MNQSQRLASLFSDDLGFSGFLANHQNISSPVLGDDLGLAGVAAKARNAFFGVPGQID
jgi:hypothetical protein